jgi:hypothetical protein
MTAEDVLLRIIDQGSSNRIQVDVKRQPLKVPLAAPGP